MAASNINEQYQDYFDMEEAEVYAEPEFYVDQFYDQIPYGEYGEEMEGGGGMTAFTFHEVVHHCVQPTVQDAFNYIAKIFAWSLVFGLFIQLPSLPSWSKHAASMVSGTMLVASFFPGSVLYLLSLVLVSYGVLAVTYGYRGPVIAAVVISYNIICESYLCDPVTWHQVRGAIMICSMKIISLGFDLDSPQQSNVTNDKIDTDKSGDADGGARRESNTGYNLRNRKPNKNKDKEEPKQELSSDFEFEDFMPGWLKYAGYCLCPGTVILGPWVSFSHYNQIINNPRFTLSSCFRIIISIFFAFLFLTISTCWSQWVIGDDQWKWFVAYRDALSFRASHYFVSFMSEASAGIAGFGAYSEDKGESRGRLEVTQPHRIEIPRSLVEVVVSWNLPMHAWLKKYVFKQARKNFGAGVAVLATYCASTLLHGLSAQLAAVLFSLGLYTWVEHSFRRKLARHLNASIESKPDTEGRYKYGDRCPWVMMLNMMFCLLSMFHLAYLGVMFDQSEGSSSGYSWRHTLTKWANLGFRSHYVVSLMMFFNCFL